MGDSLSHLDDLLQISSNDTTVGLITKSGRFAVTRRRRITIIIEINITKGLIIIERTPRNIISILITYQWWILFLEINRYFRSNQFVMQNGSKLNFFQTVALNINEHSTDEGRSPETSGHLLRFWHFQQHSQLLFPYCSTKCHAAYEVFNFLHVLTLSIPLFVENYFDEASQRFSGGVHTRTYCKI